MPATQILSARNKGIDLNVLSPTDVEQIHQATLKVLHATGVRFPSEAALDVWEAHGAQVDRSSGMVRPAPDLVEKALSSAPPVYTLAARDPALDLPLDGLNTYAGTDGCGVEVIDLHSGERRRSCLQDVADIARVADALPQVGFHWVAVSAQDMPPETRSLYELRAIWQNSSKHVQTESIYTEREAHAAVRMAELMAGGADALRERPLLSIMQCTASPLGQDGGSLDAALIAAAAGLPVGFMTMASAASTAPATLAGTLVVGNAEVISALAMIQLAHPGAPVYYAAAQTAMDLRTGGYTGGGPEDFLFGAATNALAEYYHVPLSMGSFATGAHQPDWQAGIENSMSTFMATASRADMLLGVGLLHGSRIWSYEQMLMDCEIFDLMAHMLRGIPVNEESLALEVINGVGAGGHFMAQKHTRAHMRELWLPRLFDRRSHTEWEEKGDGARQWARARALELLNTHQPLPLDPALDAGLLRIIEAA